MSAAFGAEKSPGNKTNALPCGLDVLVGDVSSFYWMGLDTTVHEQDSAGSWMPCLCSLLDRHGPGLGWSIREPIGGDRDALGSVPNLREPPQQGACR